MRTYLVENESRALKCRFLKFSLQICLQVKRNFRSYKISCNVTWRYMDGVVSVTGIKSAVLVIKLYMFRTVPLSIIRSFSLYTQQWYMSYRFADSLREGSVQNWFSSDPACAAISKPVWHTPLLCVQRKTLGDGQRNCPKHIEFYSKNKFEKLVHLVGFITRIYHDARSHER